MDNLRGSVVVALLVALAGCSSSSSPGDAPTSTDAGACRRSADDDGFCDGAFSHVFPIGWTCDGRSTSGDAGPPPSAPALCASATNTTAGDPSGGHVVFCCTSDTTDAGGDARDGD